MYLNSIKCPNPVGQRVIVKVVLPDDSSIVLPDNVVGNAGTLVVIKVGAAVTLCKPGDAVLLLPDTNIIVLDDKQKLGIIHENNIMAVEEQE